MTGAMLCSKNENSMSTSAHFLVIESDPTKIEPLTNVARLAGAGNVIACQSTEEAEIAFGENSFDFILCRDHLSPESGCEFIARMRGRNMQTPVAFVSTSPAARNVLAAAKIENAEFLTMPFALSDLTACINRLQAS